MWLLSWVLRHVHEAIGYPLFGALGALIYWLVPARRRLGERNMRQVLGPEASPAAVRARTIEASRTMALNYYEMFHMPAYSRESIRARMQIDGVQHIDGALARGRGVVLASLHLGNFETLVHVPSLYPYMRFMMLVEKMQNKGMLRIISELRGTMGVDIVSTDELRRLVRRLKENGVVALACDRDVTGSGALVDFFGRPARLPDGPVRLAARAGAALIPATGWREAGGGFRVHIAPPLDLASTGDADADACVNQRRLVAWLEQTIRERPGKWMAFYPVWN
jgi:KDO2-lipid IV(A) lauroyltransferase